MKNLSLTEFIELPDVKAKLREEFEKPRFSVDKLMLAPVLTSSPQMVGTAFDYLMRFCVQYLNPNAVSINWVANDSLKILEDIKDDDSVLFNPKYRLIKVPNVDKVPPSVIENYKKAKYKYYEEATSTIKSAKENLLAYLKSGRVEDKLITSAIDLAELDVLHRAGYLPPLNGSKHEKNDVEDLRRLISIIDPKTIKADHTCVLNPTFGPEANKLMKADGDLIIDETFIDIKTVKNVKMDRKIYNQLIGYYTLYRIGGIRGMPSDNKITKLGVYYSRHGYLHIYRVEDIINESTYLDFIQWFKERALKPWE